MGGACAPQSGRGQTLLPPPVALTAAPSSLILETVLIVKGVGASANFKRIRKICLVSDEMLHFNMKMDS